MPAKLQVYLESTDKRTFASALDWPGWSRSGRDEAAALDALVTYGPRYRRAMGKAAGTLTPPDASGLDVVQRIKGDASTDFGVPGLAPRGDDRPLTPAELKRHEALLKASWAAFDRAARAAEGVDLRKGPRGGGRELEGIIDHVLQAEASYVRAAGGPKPEGAGDAATVRRAVRETLRSRVAGELPTTGPRGGSYWSGRYFVRRAIWHVLDHAWEIQDRASPDRGG